MASPNTNPIAVDTCNMPVNLQTELSQFLGKIANRLDVSKGELVRQLIRDGLKLRDPDLAAKWDSIKAARYTQAITLCFVGSLVVWQTFLMSVDLRRAPRPTRKPEIEEAA